MHTVKFALFIALLTAAHAQTPIAQAPNMVRVCIAACTVTASTNPAAVFQFGEVKGWANTFTATLPLYVNYTNERLLGQGSILWTAAYAPNELDAQMTTAAYKLTLQGGAVVTIPALSIVAPPVIMPIPPVVTPIVVTPPVTKTLLGTYTCTVLMYSDLTFTTKNTDCVVKP